MPERPRVDAVVVCAMPLEAEPYLDRAQAPVADAVTIGGASQRIVTIDALELLLVQSGIGLVNAAMAATRALASYDAPILVSSGTAGGLAGVAVGDVAVGTVYAYSVADATFFGYEPGQIPGMPVAFDAAKDLLERARVASNALAIGGFVPAAQGGSPVAQVKLGPIVSGDTFVAGELLTTVQERWPDAVATDMESTALAQVAYAHGVDFVSVRGISDLCGPAADDDFSLNAGEVAARACERVLTILAR